MILSLLLCLALTATSSLRAQPSKSSIEQQLEHHGYIDVQQLDTSLFVSLMYARADNFVGFPLYTNLRRAYLHPHAAAALVRAQRRLKQLRPDLSLKVYDAARPMRIQQRMWDKVKNTPMQNYVSNPAHGGGLHNYGLAVDITLCDLRGDTLDMGTRIDYLGRRAHIDIEDQLVAQHQISSSARRNRRLLRQVMRWAGFKPLRTEWWHFNYTTRARARLHYAVIE